MKDWEEDEKKTLTTCETFVMKTVWDHEGDYNIQELLDAVNREFERDYKRSTVVNFLLRLSDKGFVKIKHKGRMALIHPLITEQEYTREMLKEQTRFWFRGKASHLVASLLEAEKIDKEERDIIRRMLNELDEDSD